MRLIDADALKEKAWDAKTQCGYVQVVDVGDIDDAPPIEERKKGRWIDTGSGQQCSECKEIQYGYDNFRYYCANCGADMRGERDEHID